MKYDLEYDSYQYPLHLSCGVRPAWLKEVERTGYVDSEENWVIEPKFSQAYGFHDGVALAGSQFNMGIINLKGDFIVAPDYTMFMDFWEGFAILEKDGEYEFFDTTGKNPFGRTFDGAAPFAWGYAAVEIDGKWWAMNPKGELVREISRDCNLSDWFSGKLVTEKEGKYGYKNRIGEWVVKPVYDYCGEYDILRSAIVSKDGKSGALGPDGQEVIPCIYDSLNGFTGGVSYAKFNGKYAVIDCEGNKIFDHVFDKIFFFFGMSKEVKGLINGEWKKLNLDGTLSDITLYGVIDMNGNYVIEPKYWSIEGFINGISPALNVRNWGLINLKDEIVAPFEYDSIEYWDGEYAMAMRPREENGCSFDEDGYIDANGKFMTEKPKTKERDSDFDKEWEKQKEAAPEGYDFFYRHQDGMGTATLNDKEGLLDENNNIVLPLIYDEVSYRKGVACVKKDGKAWFVDKTGEKISPCYYEDGNQFWNGSEWAAVKINGKWGYINRDFNFVIRPEWDEVFPGANVEDDRIPVKRNGKWGFVNSKGEIVIDLQFGYTRGFADGYAVVCTGNEDIFGLI